MHEMRNQMELEEYNQSLIHICKCKDERNCKLPKCKRFRKIVEHIRICTIIAKRNCPTCSLLLRICHHHAQHCHNASCTIPLCARMKQIIGDHNLEHRIEQANLRRRRLREMMRLPTNGRVGKRSAGAM